MNDPPPPKLSDPGEVTVLLEAWSHGDKQALDRLLPLVFTDLRSIADRVFRHEARNRTLQPTEVVNEAFLRMVGQRSGFRNRQHFFAIAAQAMRRVLLDRARARAADKRGGVAERVTLAEDLAVGSSREVDLIDLDSALTNLASIDAQQAKIVELRYFGGLTVEETAEAVGLSVTTVKREWAVARAFLYRELARS